MGLNDTPSGERIHIGFFGRRNAGKSSLVNAVTGQELSIVSDTLGTTTDPVKKAMELLPLGPVVIIDTPGFDDEGSLGKKRIQQSRKVLGQSDIAVLVVSADEGIRQCDLDLIDLFKERQIPFIIAFNKSDLLGDASSAAQLFESSANTVESITSASAVPVPQGASVSQAAVADSASVPSSASELKETEHIMYVSAKNGTGIYELKERIARLIKPEEKEVFMCGDLIKPGDIVLLVIPIDKAAPKGRLILPEQMVIRDCLDNDAIPVCIKEDRLRDFLQNSGLKPALVITDSQVFAEVDACVPEEIPLTSFSILMARHKGFLTEAVKGVAALEKMKLQAVRTNGAQSHIPEENAYSISEAADPDEAADPSEANEPLNAEQICQSESSAALTESPAQETTDKQFHILISEGCTHHRQCEDIGTVKIPRWLNAYLGANAVIDFSSGQGFPEDLSGFDLIIHCGGCMLNEQEMKTRMLKAKAQGVPMTNYGIAIAQFKGILKRATAMFPDIAGIKDLWTE